MEQTNIQNLPLEILVHIFNYLPVKSLLTMVSVNKYFEYIIKNFSFSREILPKMN